LVYYDVKTARAVDQGRINNWESICRTLGLAGVYSKAERQSALSAITDSSLGVYAASPDSFLYYPI
jgi:hypothetical protein